MRTSIRNLGILVACAAGGIAGVAAAAGKRAAPVQKEAEVFLATVTGLISPVANSTNIADWQAATDVTPEHTGRAQRAPTRRWRRWSARPRSSTRPRRC